MDRGNPSAGPDTENEALVSAIAPYCSPATFAEGDVMRKHGRHYRNMVYLLSGRVRVQLTAGKRRAQTLIVGAGQPIGEIGFLSGRPASADVVAEEPGEFIEVNDQILARLEASDPELAARLLRRLADITASRNTENSVFGERFSITPREHSIDVLICRDDHMLQEAKRLRYTVYCRELGRDSPNADHDAKIITDEMDAFAHVFIACMGDDLIGTIRVNNPGEGAVGILDDLYGLPQSPYYPKQIGIVTKFVIKPAYRGGLSALKMIAAITRFGDNYNAKECYIDCVPGLLHYYRALGFEICGPAFLHRENGTSIPMRLDLDRYGEGLKREPGLRQIISLYLRAKLFKAGHRLAKSKQWVPEPSPEGAA